MIDFGRLACSYLEWPAEIRDWVDSTKQRDNSTPVVLLEISGADSIAAAITLSDSLLNSIVIPTTVIVPTEFGDRDATRDQAERILRAHLRSRELKPFIYLKDYDAWSLLSGKFIPSLIRDFGIYSPCIGCHAYVHVMRLALAKILNCQLIVTGERLHHGTTQKVNQMPESLRYHKELAEAFGVSLSLPLESVKQQKEVERLLPSWYDKSLEARCVFTSNLEDPRETLFSTERLSLYYERFIVPVGTAYLKWLFARWEGNQNETPRRSLSEVINQSIR